LDTLLQRRFGHLGAATIWTCQLRQIRYPTAEALDTLVRRRFGHSISSTHWTGHLINTLDLQHDTLDTLVRGRTRRHKIVLSPRFQYRPPPHQCIGHQLLDASDRPTQQHIGHTARHIGPPKIILTPHYQYGPPPHRCIGHTTSGRQWTGQPSNTLGTPPPQRRI